MNNKSEILNELNELAPVLASLKETQKPLDIPENYFSVNADFLVELAADKNSILPALPEQKLEIPEGYFTSFADTVLSTIREEEQLSKPKTIPLKSPNKKESFIFIRTIAVAATIIGIAVTSILYFINQHPKIVDCTDGIACLTQQEIYEYIYHNSHEFGTHQVEVVAESAIADSTIITNLEIDDDAIQHYLEENMHENDWDDATSDIF